MVSIWVHWDISDGREETRLLEMFSFVKIVKLRGSLGGILLMTLLAKLQEWSGVFLIRWNTASGICISWHSLRSNN